MKVRNYHPRMVHRPMNTPIWVSSALDVERGMDEAAELHNIQASEIIPTLYDRLLEGKDLYETDKEKIELSVNQLAKGETLEAIDLMLQHFIEISDSQEVLTKNSSLNNTIYRIAAEISDDLVQ